MCFTAACLITLKLLLELTVESRPIASLRHLLTSTSVGGASSGNNQSAVSLSNYPTTRGNKGSDWTRLKDSNLAPGGRARLFDEESGDDHAYELDEIRNGSKIGMKRVVEVTLNWYGPSI